MEARSDTQTVETGADDELVAALRSRFARKSSDELLRILTEDDAVLSDHARLAIRDLLVERKVDIERALSPPVVRNRKIERRCMWAGGVAGIALLLVGEHLLEIIPHGVDVKRDAFLGFIAGSSGLLIGRIVGLAITWRWTQRTTDPAQANIKPRE
ncbi:MAG: hypothetical protein WAW96_06670 [Alphaproteobacteria bacterium]